MMTFFVDFETYYDKQVSITELGIHHYLHHYDCDIYMVSIYSAEAGFSYVGEPAAADWRVLHGQRVVAHNVRFDRACFLRLQEAGVIPADVVPADWQCTADMVSAFSFGRSLKEACAEIFGVVIDKRTRNELCGQSWLYLKMSGKAEEVAQYCLKDAWYCGKLWERLSGAWSDRERKLSALTRDMCDYGVAVDHKMVEQGRQTLLRVLDEAVKKIPWADGSKPVLSPKHLREECAKAGITPPSSLAADSEECAAWEAKYGDTYPWVAAMRDYRRANTLFKKLDTLYERIREDGTFSYGLKYFGAHTGRWSGDAGFNIQNLPRTAMFDVDLRRMIIPRPGCKFVISDLGQIEQRVLSWLAGDNAMMELLETGVSVYEAHARATMGYKGEDALKHADPALYRLAKARVLGLGYGASASVFPKIAMSMAGIEVTPAQAQRIVREFRASNPLICQLWAKLERAFSMHMGKDFTLPLPSGRKLYYHHLARTPKGLSAVVQGKRCGFFGGKLAENLTSATARDVLGDILIRLDEAGYRVVMHVHDEVVVEVPEAKAKEAAADIHRIMTTPIDWLEGLPLAAETITSPYYTK